MQSNIYVIKMFVHPNNIRQPVLEYHDLNTMLEKRSQCYDRLGM
jgi:hypothetical protein